MKSAVCSPWKRFPTSIRTEGLLFFKSVHIHASKVAEHWTRLSLSSCNNKCFHDHMTPIYLQSMNYTFVQKWRIHSFEIGSFIVVQGWDLTMVIFSCYKQGVLYTAVTYVCACCGAYVLNKNTFWSHFTLSIFTIEISLFCRTQGAAIWTAARCHDITDWFSRLSMKRFWNTRSKAVQFSISSRYELIHSVLLSLYNKIIPWLSGPVYKNKVVSYW